MSILLESVAAWQQVPSRVWEAVHLEESGLRGLFFESEVFRGRATRVFAWMGLPEGADAGHPVPGMVLIHGGGGTAFARWVRWWNRRGYAAIAMDTCGAMSLPATGALGSADWPRHSHAGPRGWGGFGEQAAWAPRDQWPFHAAAAVVRAHSLLAAQCGVDRARIGVTGVSWGGYLTCLAAGLDARFRCAAPVYGCGYVSETSVWADGGEYAALAPAQRQFWREHWDPAAVLPRASCPMFWLNGTNDFAYYPPVWQRSAAATRGARHLCLKVRYPHGHIPAAEESRDLAAFADACLAGGAPLLTVAPPEEAGGVLRARYGAERPLRAAALLVTPCDGPWPEREWYALPASVDAADRVVEARLPAEVNAACFSLVSEDWLTTTSDLVFR